MSNELDVVNILSDQQNMNNLQEYLTIDKKTYLTIAWYIPFYTNNLSFFQREIYTFLSNLILRKQKQKNI